jgi:hypothetical protein
MRKFAQRKVQDDGDLFDPPWYIANTPALYAQLRRLAYVMLLTG